MTRSIFAAVATLVLAGTAAAATPEQVDEAVRRGVAFLESRQNALGNWESGQQSPGDGATGGGADAGQWGGRTALCTYALLAAGERVLDPKVGRPVEFLRSADVRGNYALGLRANVWVYLPQTKENLAALAKDNQLLHKGVARPALPSGDYAYTDGGPRTGFLFDYTAGGNRIDLSCSQYGVLGCWAAAQRLPDAAKDVAFWERVEAAWLALGNPDGGWTYNGVGSGPSTLQMTAAGVATLFITQELAHANDDADRRGQGNATHARQRLDDGLKWISDNLAQQLAGTLNLYALYGIERIGVASGYKYFGAVDWYQACADALVSRQQADGSWGGQYDASIDTSFALLFLARGRSPVMANKLSFHVTAPSSGKTAESHWDKRPRDIANVTRWVEEQTERRLNWQIVDLDVGSVDDLHDAPVLYVTTDVGLFLTEDEKAKLKQYVEEGGLIVFNADRASPQVAKSVRTLGQDLFPGLAFNALTASGDDQLRRSEQFPIGGQKRPVKVEGLSNGARLLMLLVPTDDLSTAYQHRDSVARASAYQFFANVFLYANEKTAVRVKGRTHVVRPDPNVKAETAVTVARVKYDGRWDPEPGGWRRLSAVSHNADKTDVQTTPWSPGDAAPAGCRIAHWTGTDAVSLNDTQRRGLAAFVRDGGLLLVDACGGSPAFDASVRAELAKMFPEAAGQLNTPMQAKSPLLTGVDGKPITPQYRDFALNALGPLAKAFQLRGLTVNGHLGVVYSPQDLSVGLVGEPVDGIIGYTPAQATELVRRVIELKTAGKI